MTAEVVPNYNSAWNEWLEGLEEATEVGYPHPFFVPDNYGDIYSGFGEDPTTLAELRMLALSWSIRSRHDWHTMVKDQTMLKRWRQKALEQQEYRPLDCKMSLDMINHALGELEGYARLIDPQTGIQHACNDSTFCSSRSISDDVLTKMCYEAAQLEEDQKNMYPNSSGPILDIVDPSLYSIVYGRTLVSAPDGTFSPLLAPDMSIPAPDQMPFHSAKLAWLPSDFSVAESGSVRLASPYINNIHPSRTGLVSAIESALGAFVPMWERVLASIWHGRKERDHTDNRGYAPSHRINYSGCRDIIDCLWMNYDDDPPPVDDELEEQEYAGFPGEDVGERRLAWMRTLPEDELSLPKAYPEYTGALEERFETVSLRGKTLQVIVRLTSVNLTPGSPEYPGEGWKVEGMMNERIVQREFMYCYDSENVTDVDISFRVSVCKPPYHNWGDNFCTQVLFGLEDGKALTQERGSITTHRGMTLAFPNIYQHRVSPFALTDRRRPGHRKILTFFLVDPEVRVPSATEVPAQQAAWYSEAIEGSLAIRLPAELRTMVAEAVEGTMTLEEAKEFRTELIEERSAFMEVYNEQVMQQTLDMTW